MLSLRRCTANDAVHIRCEPPGVVHVVGDSEIPHRDDRLRKLRFTVTDHCRGMAGWIMQASMWFQLKGILDV